MELNWRKNNFYLIRVCKGKKKEKRKSKDIKWCKNLQKMCKLSKERDDRGKKKKQLPWWFKFYWFILNLSIQWKIAV